MFGTSIATGYGGFGENIPFPNPRFFGGCGTNPTGASSNITFCKLCSATMLLQASNDTYDRAKFLHNLFRVLELKLTINIENCSSLNFPLCEVCFDMVRSLWVCQNTMDSLLESRRILVGLVVDKARQGVSQDWRTGRAPPPPFCFLRMCSTLILDKQHLGHVKRIVADYFPTPTMNGNHGEGGRMNAYPSQTLPQLNAQVNAAAGERNRIHFETSQTSVNTSLSTVASSQPNLCPSSSTTNPGTSTLTSSSAPPQASTSTNSVLPISTIPGLQLGPNKQIPPSTEDSSSGTQNGNKIGVIKGRKDKMDERNVDLNNLVAGLGPVRGKLQVQGVEIFRHEKSWESKKMAMKTGVKPAASDSIPDTFSSSTPSTSTSCSPNATDADKGEWVPSIESVRGRDENTGDKSENVPSTPQLNTALARANATCPPLNEEELGLTSTERVGTISDDEIFELEPKARNIMVNGVHIFECIGMFGSNKGKKFYQCGRCSFMLPVEPLTTSQTPPVERMATHIQNAHKSDSSSATHSIPLAEHSGNELKDQVATTTSTFNAFSKDGKRAYTLLSTPNMEPDTEAPSLRPSTSKVAPWHHGTPKFEKETGASRLIWSASSRFKKDKVHLE